MSEKLVSIIVPVYKVEPYLEKCLQSIVLQTYKHIEVILVDDGSPDCCPQICDMWAHRDSRIKVIHQKNQGVSAARNAAMACLTGEFLMFVDSDDWIEQTMVEKMVRSVDENEDVDVVFCGYKEVTGTTENIFRIVEPQTTGIVDRNKGVAQIFGDYSTMLWNKLFRTSILQSNPEFDKKIMIGEDELWMIQNLKNARNIALINESLYFYRSRLDGASKNFELSAARLSEVASQKMVLSEISKYGAKELTLLAQKRMYYSCQHIMKIAFYQDNIHIFNWIDTEIDDVRKVWFAQHNNLLGKCRRKMVEHMMRKNYPKCFIKLFDK